MKNNRTSRNKRIIREVKPYNYLIICEGTKTEPNYFNGIKKKVTEKYGNKIDVYEPPKIEVKGIGHNTESLVEYTNKRVNYSSKQYGQVWVIFDKDDYLKEQFNNAIFKNSYYSGWSNPNFELWLLLHFTKVSNEITKEVVLKKLQDEFKKHKLGRYNKNDIDIFEKVTKEGSLEIAIKLANELMKKHEGQIPADSNPATNVYKLLEQLAEYLK